MGKQDIIGRILSDAEAEASAMLEEAASRAESIRKNAEDAAAREREKAQKECEKKRLALLEGRRAAARLDAQKIALSGKRRVIDVVYGRAEDRLSKLEEDASLALVSSLLERYAEKGDEVVLAEDYPFLAGVKKLPVVREKALTVSEEGAKISGGVILRNQSCDRDLSLSSLLAADKEAHQAELAGMLFPGKK